jgi:hypothetical protein
MNRYHKIRLLFYFYRQQALVLLLTLGFMIWIAEPRGLAALFFIFPFVIARAVLYVLLLYIYRIYSIKTLIFYQNLGLSQRLLWCFTFGFDLVLTIIALLILSFI